MATRALLLGVFAIALTAQSQSPSRVAFDVASVKPHPSSDRGDFRFPEWLPGGRFQVTAGLLQIINNAYNLPINPSVRLSGGPDWIRGPESVFEIEATGTFPPGLAGNVRADRQRQMLQALLADRFKLVMRRETKELPVYALVVAKGGPKLHQADIEEKDCPDALPDPQIVCHALNGGQGRGLHGRAVDMSDVVRFVENWTYRPLIDRTGIKGLYRIETSGWTPIQAGPPPPEGTKGEDGRDLADVPTLFQVFAGLGLRMESSKARVDVFVIEHIEKPSAN